MVRKPLTSAMSPTHSLTTHTLTAHTLTNSHPHYLHPHYSKPHHPHSTTTPAVMAPIPHLLLFQASPLTTLICLSLWAPVLC